jgi:hypothetical protein
MLVRGLSRGAVFDFPGCKDFSKEHIPVLFEHLGDSIAPDDIGPDAEQSAGIRILLELVRSVVDVRERFLGIVFFSTHSSVLINDSLHIAARRCEPGWDHR